MNDHSLLASILYVFPISFVVLAASIMSNMPNFSLRVTAACRNLAARAGTSGCGCIIAWPRLERLVLQLLSIRAFIV